MSRDAVLRTIHANGFSDAMMQLEPGSIMIIEPDQQITFVVREYVAGFLFDHAEENVALILKGGRNPLHPNRLTWQEGKHNAIGGKVEPGETPLEAMRREFKEEALKEVTEWREFCVLEGDGFRVHFFMAHADNIHDVQSGTDEPVHICGVHDLPQALMTNLRWLILMAQSMKDERAAAFLVKEQYPAGAPVTTKAISLVIEVRP